MDSPSPITPPPRVVEAVDRKISAGEYYDATQLVKTFAQRYTSRGEGELAAVLCRDYAVRLADSGEGSLCLELGTSLLHILTEQFSGPSEEQLEALVSVLRAATAKAAHKPGAKELEAFISRGHRIYKLLGSDVHVDVCDPHGGLLRGASPEETVLEASNSTGLRQRHTAVLATTVVRRQESLGHLVYCHDAKALGELISEWALQGYPSERSFFWLRAVLLLLCLGDTDTSSSLLNDYAPVDFDSEDVPAPFQLALLLTAACRVKSVASFDLISRKYTMIMRRDPFFAKCASHIRFKVLGVVEQTTNPIASLFSSLLSGPTR